MRRHKHMAQLGDAHHGQNGSDDYTGNLVKEEIAHGRPQNQSGHNRPRVWHEAGPQATLQRALVHALTRRMSGK